MALQNVGSPNFENFEAPKSQISGQSDIWMQPQVANHIKYYKREDDDFPSCMGCDESCESMYACGSFVH
jgi:hypothetical protein